LLSHSFTDIVMHSQPYFVDWALEHLLYCIVLYCINDGFLFVFVDYYYVSMRHHHFQHRFFSGEHFSVQSSELSPLSSLYLFRNIV